MASLYVHFPWCLAKCPYCDFVSYKAERAAIDHDAYADAVIRELSFRQDAFNGRTVATLFFGGGTPSLWDPGAIARVIGEVRKRFPCADDLEISVECNPTSLDAERARALADASVNRLSIGTQSLRGEQLEFLGRLHDMDGALRSIEGALAISGLRVSSDLIFGLPGQTPQDAANQADRLASLGLVHLSCYQLTIEPGTRFGELAKVGRLPLAEDGAVAEGFLAIEETLGKRGLRHYEISNYAEPGEEARHNLGYWRGDDYLGVGCGAFGFVRDGARGERWRNQIDPTKYIETTGRPEGPTMTTETLDAEALLRERIMLGLRTTFGADLGRAASELEIDPWTGGRLRAIAMLEERGRLVRSGDVLRIPPHAWLFADDTAARLF